MDLVSIVMEQRREEEMGQLGGHLPPEGLVGPRGKHRRDSAIGDEPGRSAEAVDREAALDAAALAARRPVDLVEADVSVAARSLVRAAERVLTLDVGRARGDVLALARMVQDLDRSLVRMAAERATAARDAR